MASNAVPAALLALFLTASAGAETVAVEWADSQFSGAVASAARQAANAAMEERSALTLTPLTGAARIKKGCAQDKGCLAELAKQAGVDHLLLLRGRQSGPRLWVDGVWWEASTQTLRVHLERDMPEAAEAARSVVEALIPAYARRGYAGLEVSAPPGVVVKVDGRPVGTTPLDAPLIVPAGKHSIDLLAPSGQSTLKNYALPEGQRIPVALTALGPEHGGRNGAGISGLRWTSYGLWTAGALAIASSFVAGTISRRADGELRACSPTSRDCTSAEDARRLSDRVDTFAGHANRLLLGGGILSAAGIGLFTWSVLASGDSASTASAPAGSSSQETAR